MNLFFLKIIQLIALQNRFVIATLLRKIKFFFEFNYLMIFLFFEDFPCFLIYYNKLI